MSSDEPAWVARLEAMGVRIEREPVDHSRMLRMYTDVSFAAEVALRDLRHIGELGDPSAAHWHAATFAIGDDPIEGLDYRIARYELAAALVDRAHELSDLVHGALPEQIDALDSGILWADQVFARFLEQRGEFGTSGAERWRTGGLDALEQARAPLVELPFPTASAPLDAAPGLIWHGWTKPSASGVRWPFLQFLAEAVWHDEVLPALRAKAEREARYAQPALLAPVARGAALTPRLGGESWVLEAAGVDATLVRAAHKSGALDTVTAQKVFHALPSIARDAAASGGSVAILGGAGIASPTAHDRIEVQINGYAAASEALDCNRIELKKVFQALAASPLQWHAERLDGTTTLILDLQDNDAGGGPDQFVRFMLPSLFHPAFAAQLKEDGNATRRHRALIPAAADVPPSTNRRIAAAAGQLEWQALLWLREHLDQVDDLGGPVPWEELAERVQLSTNKQRTRRLKTLNGLLDLWKERGRWACAGDRWRPADDGQWGVILQAKADREDGRRRQAAGKKRQKRRR